MYQVTQYQVSLGFVLSGYLFLVKLILKSVENVVKYIFGNAPHSVKCMFSNTVRSLLGSYILIYLCSLFESDSKRLKARLPFISAIVSALVMRLEESNSPCCSEDLCFMLQFEALKRLGATMFMDCLSISSYVRQLTKPFLLSCTCGQFLECRLTCHLGVSFIQ